MAITLEDVAQHCGVSRSTVSRALSGSPLISVETRSQVEAIALKLGYRPNRAASTLRSKQSHLLGLVMNNLLNASFHTIAEVVQRRAMEAGYQVILSISDADPRRERAALEMMADQGVDGLLIIGTGQNTTTTNHLQSTGTAVVNVIRSPRGSAAPAVLAADRDGAYAATSYLIDLGHRRIGFVGGPPGTNSGDERNAGYAEAMGSVGGVDAALVRRGPFDPSFGVAAAEELLARPVKMTALLAANHEAVFGILPTLIAHKIDIPRDLSLICYEDISWLRWWQPAVSVVDNGASELGDLAMDLLMQQLDRRSRSVTGELVEAPRPGRTYRVGAQLVHRDSCSPPGLAGG